MSLISQNQNYSVRDYLFIVAGLLGLFGFFMSYASQDPRSMINGLVDQSTVVNRGVEVAERLGFDIEDYDTQVLFGSDAELLDTLQVNPGRKQIISRFRSDSLLNLYPYFWEVHLSSVTTEDQENGISFGDGPGGPPPQDVGELIIRFSPSGEWIELVNNSNRFPEQNINMQALQTIIPSDTLLNYLGSAPDTLLREMFSFNLEEGYNNLPADSIADQNIEGPEYQLGRDDVLLMSRYHISRSGWNFEQFAIGDIRIATIGDITVAQIQYESIAPIVGQDVTLQTLLSPTGSLVAFEAAYSSSDIPPQGGPSVDDFLVPVTLFLFAIGAIFIFYIRIRTRVVDTKSALVVSMVTGFVIPVLIFLNEAQDFNLFGEGSSWTEFLILFMMMGVLGAVAAVGFFILSAIGDSITRQHWREKLESFDYLRQGTFFNKPVGEVLVRSVVLTFILAGLWSMLLWLFPNVYFQISEPFLDYEVLWAPLYAILYNLWYSLLVVFGIFLVLGSQVYSMASNKWLAGTTTVAAVALVAPIPFSMGPIPEQFPLLLIIGLVLTLIYFQWDFLTILFTHFMFNCLLVVSSGWIVGGSPDFYLFVSFCLLVLFVSVGGTAAIIKGKDEHSLPEYVPEYVEELAQEERIKQELQIARDVQQSFLPVDTPAIGGLDLTAACKPAYETGGDYYDFIQLDDHRLAVTVGDVSGKGIQAAFYMTFIKGILHTLGRETESPAEVLRKANKLFYENARRGTFISLIYGIIDTRENTFHFARAGHNPLMHISSKTGEIELLQPEGLGLGLTVTDKFENHIREISLKLDDEDILVLYTDGIVEALNNLHQFYGTNRLQQVIKKSKEKKSEEILSSLMGDVAKFSDEEKQHDDMTVMIIKLNNKE